MTSHLRTLPESNRGQARKQGEKSETGEGQREGQRENILKSSNMDANEPLVEIAVDDMTQV